MFVTVSFYGPRYELIHICLRCAGHIPTGSTIYNSPDQEQIQQLLDRHICLQEPSPEGLRTLEELGYFDAVANIVGVPHL